MNVWRHKTLRAVAIVLTFAVLQVGLQLGFAESLNPTSPSTAQQSLLGRITTRGTSPAQVNGNNVSSGDSIASGSEIQTPADTDATIDLGPIGSVKFMPGSRARVDFSCPSPSLSDPTKCRLTVTLFSGCLISKYRQGSHHEILNATQTRIAESDPAKEKNGGGVIKICSDGSMPPETGNGLRRKALFAILGGAGGAIAIAIATTGDNPSPSMPGG